jgi:hypothetical protein
MCFLQEGERARVHDMNFWTRKTGLLSCCSFKHFLFPLLINRYTMKRLTYMLLNFLLLCNDSYGQNTFEKAFSISSGGAQSLLVMSNDQVLLSVGDSAGHISFVKLDATGQVIWTKKAAVSGYFAYSADAAENPAGGFYVVSCGFDSSAGYMNYILLGLDATGNALWSKKYSMTVSSAGYAIPRIKIDLNGLPVLSLGYEDRICIVRTDNLGNITWTGAYTADAALGKNPGYDVVICSDNGLLAVGKADSDIFLVRISSTGQVLWTRRHQNTSLAIYHRPYCMIRTMDGNFLIAGMDLNTTHAECGFLMKIDSSGNMMWYKRYTAAPDYIEFRRMVEMSNGNIFVTGQDTWSYNTCIVMTDASGNLIYSLRFPTAQTGPWSIQEAGDVSRNTLDEIYFSPRLSGAGIYTGVFRAPASSIQWCNSVNGNVFMPVLNYNPLVTTPCVNLSSVTASSISWVVTSAVVNETYYCPVGSQEVIGTVSDFSLFPNPLISATTLQIDRKIIEDDMQLIMYDALGNSCMQMPAHDNTQITRGNLSTGIYIYQVVSSKGILHSGKLVITD